MQHKLAKYRSWGGTGCASETLWFKTSYSPIKGQLGRFSCLLYAVTSRNYLLIPDSWDASAGPSCYDLVRPVEPVLPPVCHSFSTWLIWQRFNIRSSASTLFLFVWVNLLIPPPMSWLAADQTEEHPLGGCVRGVRWELGYPNKNSLAFVSSCSFDTDGAESPEWTGLVVITDPSLRGSGGRGVFIWCVCVSGTTVSQHMTGGEIQEKTVVWLLDQFGINQFTTTAASC